MRKGGLHLPSPKKAAALGVGDGEGGFLFLATLDEIILFYRHVEGLGRGYVHCIFQVDEL